MPKRNLGIFYFIEQFGVTVVNGLEIYKQNYKLINQLKN